MNIGKFTTPLAILLLLVTLLFTFASSTNHNNAAPPLSIPLQSGIISTATETYLTDERAVGVLDSGSKPKHSYGVGRPDMLYEHRLLYSQPGTTIAEGTNTTLIGPGKLKTYRVEEVTLPISITRSALVFRPANNEAQEQVITVNKIWRFTIISEGSSYEGDSHFSVWLDDAIVGTGLDIRGAITVIVYDRALLREGTTIGLGIESAKPVYYLPEKFQFKRTP